MRAKDTKTQISIVIPTYRRAGIIPGTIKAFSGQTCGSFEMIIVEQGPEVMPKEEMSDWNLPFPIRYLRQEEPNLPKARNAGIKAAAADIVLFCDDDIVPDKSLVEKHLDNYKDDRVGGVGGRVIDISKRKKRPSLKSFYPFVATFNPLDGSLFFNFDKDTRREVKHINGCNMSFRKEPLIRAGLFDELLGGTSNTEDTDMSFRIRRLGYRLIFEPGAVVKHLGLTYGGCQMDSIYEHIYWLYFTDTVFFLKYVKKIFFPFFFLRVFTRLAVYVLTRRDPTIAVHAKKGFLEALKREI